MSVHFRKNRPGEGKARVRLRMVSLGDVDETARFLATSRGTDVFPVNMPFFLLKYNLS